MSKKWIYFSITIFSLSIMVGAASAAELANLSGQSCGEDVGTWHFVNNQTGLDAGVGTLTATFSSGEQCVTEASKVNRRTQHFFCVGYSGDLLSASTNLEGRLVLSDFSCEKKEDPPNCDPKTDPDCKE